MKDFNGAMVGAVTTGNALTSPIISRELRIGIPSSPTLDQALATRLIQENAGLNPSVRVTFIIVS